LYESALAVARKRNDPQASGVVLFALSDTLHRLGDRQTAERLIEEAVALTRSGGDEFVLSLSLGSVGELALAAGDQSRALAAYREALDLGLGIDSAWAVANTLSGFAALAAARGDHAGAARLLGAAETWLQASHQDRYPNYAHHARTTEAARAALGAAAFAAEWRAGRALSIEEAAELPRALGLLDENAPAPMRDDRAS
jgi:tetratricopeptide (TPR) repeat protein